MYRTTVTFHKMLERGLIPTPYIFIKTDFGTRVYSEKDPGTLFSFGTYYLDGSWTLDGSVLAGDELIIDIGARVKSFGNYNRTISTNKYNLLLASQIKKQNFVTIILNDKDRHFSKILAKEPFLTQEVNSYLGFFGLPRSEHLKRFSGTINEIKRERGLIYLNVIES